MTGGGGGGGDRGSYFTLKKITTSEFVYPKKSLLFLAHPKKSLSPVFATQRNPSGFFSRPKKIPASFIDPKKSLWAKISDPKKSLGLSPPPPSLKYVSGAPGVINHLFVATNVSKVSARDLVCKDLASSSPLSVRNTLMM